jgi:hypothetical protein
LQLGFAVLLLMPSFCFSPCELFCYFIIFLQGGNNEKRMSGDLGTFKDKTLAVNKLKETCSLVLLCFSSCSSLAFLFVTYCIIFCFLQGGNNEKERRANSDSDLKKN